jgi:hypothetical protein
LDPGIFSLEKAEATKAKPMKILNPQTRQLIKVLNGYQKARRPNDVTAAFQRTGIVTYKSIEHQNLLAQVERSSATNIDYWARVAANCCA